MNLLKKEHWWVWLLFMLFGNTITVFILGAFLDVYDKDSWYAKPHYWVLGLVFFIFPFFIMLMIFQIQILTKVASNLEVHGYEWYTSPYVWILSIIIPFIGWLFLTFMMFYLNISIVIMLAKGKGEKYSY